MAAKAKTETPGKVDLKDVKKPEDKLTFKQGEKEVELFMSYALLSRLTRLCPDPEKLQAIAFFPNVQDLILETLLAPKTETGKPDIEKYDMETHTKDISADKIQEIILWAVGHMSYFFIGLMNKNLEHAALSGKAMQAIKERSEQIAEMLTPAAPTDSATGSAS